jgi:transposase InsO family protein
MLRTTICELFKESRMAYGHRRIWQALRNKSIVVSEKVVRRLMALEGLSVLTRHKSHYNSYQGEITPAPHNLINRGFSASAPNLKWLTDITEMAASDGKVYLSPIIDCFDGMVVSWTMGLHPNALLVNTMLSGAIAKLKPNEKPTVHSGRGCHCRWPDWIKLMNGHSLTRSMSKKGCSPDNSACEGFFGRLKNEMFYSRDWSKKTAIELMAAIDDYIRWYNTERIKMSLGGLSPALYRQSLGLAA